MRIRFRQGGSIVDAHSGIKYRKSKQEVEVVEERGIFSIAQTSTDIKSDMLALCPSEFWCPLGVP